VDGKPARVAVGVAVGVAVAVGVTVGVAVAVGVLVGVAVAVSVAVGAPPDGAGIAPLSIRMSSTTISRAVDVVAPRLKRVAWDVKLSAALEAKGLPKALSPVAR
jgi:hypothetical protein